MNETELEFINNSELRFVTKRIVFRRILANFCKCLGVLSCVGMLTTFFMPKDSIGGSIFRIAYRCILCIVPLCFADDFIGWHSSFWFDLIFNKLSVIGMLAGFAGALFVTGFGLESSGHVWMYVCFGLLYLNFVLMVIGRFKRESF